MDQTGYRSICHTGSLSVTIKMGGDPETDEGGG